MPINRNYKQSREYIERNAPRQYSSTSENQPASVSITQTPKTEKYEEDIATYRRQLQQLEEDRSSLEATQKQFTSAMEELQFNEQQLRQNCAELSLSLPTQDSLLVAILMEREGIISSIAEQRMQMQEQVEEQFRQQKNRLAQQEDDLYREMKRKEVERG